MRRSVLSLLCALALLVQGLAVAAADYSLPAPGAAAEQILPCHDEPADPGSLSCCDENCPNMTSCLLSQLAPATVFAAFDSAASAAAVFADSAAAPPLSSPQSLLRPPIVSHA